MTRAYSSRVRNTKNTQTPVHTSIACAVMQHVARHVYQLIDCATFM